MLDDYKEGYWGDSKVTHATCFEAINLYQTAWLCVRCLEKVNKYSPKWWFNGDLSWYKVNNHIKQTKAKDCIPPT